MSNPDSLNANQQEAVRRQVRDALERNQAFQAMPAEHRRKIAHDTVRVLSYITDPTAGDATLAEAAQRAGVTARAMAEGDPPIPQQPKKEGVTGAAIDKAGEAFEQLANSVNFPEFVGGLIDAVFTSIVDSSIKQMEAYGELLASVVKSVDEFANDNFTDNQARDYLQSSFPGALRIDAVGDQPRVRMNPQIDDDQAPDFGKFLGVQDSSYDLDDEASEAELVRQAKLKMARSRQQQLATMVVLGINRIVVTNGKINAKVVFDVKASENSSFKASAEYHDKKTHTDYSHTRKRSFWGTTRTNSGNVNTRVTTLDSNTTQESNESISAKAQLTGEVSVNFKSETFPLEKLASADQLLTVNSLSNPNTPQQ
ncbi:MAG: hypothetical protein H6739_22230 [Alphaproteobacteria bacterium]|nr:hypothetical protein [Alphaproteobacteria bacterium]